MKRISVPLFLILATAVLLYPVIFSKTASFCIELDNVHQGYPFFCKLNSSLHKGYIPVWDANTYGGRSFAGEIQPGVFYPISIIWCWMFGAASGIDVYYLDLLVCLHYLVSVLGMYSLARRLELSVAGSVFASLVFTFTGALSFRASAQTWTFFGLAWLPWVVYFVAGYYFVLRKKRYLICAGLVAGLQILAGHIQPFYHTILICGIVVCFYEFQQKKNWSNFLIAVCAKLGMIILFAFFISLPQLYYSAQYLPHSYRYVSGGYYIKMGQKVPQFIYTHWFVIGLQNLGNLFGEIYDQPNDGNIIYMGILPLFLVVFFLLKKRSILTSPEQARLSKVLLIIFVVGTLSALGYITLFSQFLYYLPLVNGVRELGRYIILISFSLSLMGGLAITNIIEFKEQVTRSLTKVRNWIFWLAALNVVYLILFQSEYIPLRVTVPYLICMVFFGLFVFSALNRQQNAVLAIAVLIVDIFLNNVNFLPTKLASYPGHYYANNRILDFLGTTYGKYRVDFNMKDISEVRRNLGDVYNIQTKWGYAATVDESYFRFVTRIASSESKVDDLLNVRYVLADQPLDSTFILKDSIPGLILYERRSFYPRCYWRHQIGENGEQIEEENRNMVNPIVYSDLYQKVDVDCARPDTLVFSENYYPGWKCYDNGKPMAIFKFGLAGVQPIFRSVYLNTGHHVLEFKYNKVFYFF